MIKPTVNKNYLKLYNETAKQRIFEILFKFTNKEFSLSDLAREANVAKPNIGKILEELYSNEFIKITKLSKIWRIKANQNNWYFIRSKIVYNLNFIYQSGLIEFLTDYFKNPKAIILFGSFRKGEDITNSDIDIAIEDDGFRKYEITDLKELNEFEKQIGKKIQLHLFNRKNIDKNLFNNIANGIVLSGFLEVNL